MAPRVSGSASRAGDVGTPRLWFALLGGHFAWTVHLLLSYALLQYACATGFTFLLHLVTLVTAGITVWALLVAHRVWKQSRPVEQGRAYEPGSGYRRSMAAYGLMLNGLFLFAILIEGLPVAFLGPCIG